MTHLSDKVSIITGASSGIGEATALAFAERGAKLVLAARRVERLEQLAGRIRALGGAALAVPCDVTDQNQVLGLVERTMEAFGRIDVLVNNAGIMPLAPLHKCRIADWDAMIDVNLKGLLYGVGHVLPVMLHQGTGHIVNVSSVAGRRHFSGAAVYCATKHAVHAFSDILRTEMAELAAEDGNTIRVTVVAPGVVRTELLASITDPDARERSRVYVGTIPDPLTPADVAAAVLYAVEAPPHVNISEVLMRPVRQQR